MRKSYTIKIDNHNYINAIAIYNQKIKITSVQFSEDYIHHYKKKEAKYGRDIASIVAEAKENEVTEIIVHYTSNAAASLFAIFPKIEPISQEEYTKTPAQDAMFNRFYGLLRSTRYDINVLSLRSPPPLALNRSCTPCLVILIFLSLRN